MVAVASALSVEVTVVAGSVSPVGTEAEHATVEAPAVPPTWSGIDMVEVWPAFPLVGITAVRVSVPEPTVSVQLTATRWLVAPLVTVAVGLANAR